MSNLSFCGVDLGVFRAQPKPSELAGIVAHLGSGDQAEFFSALAQVLKDTCGGRESIQISAIANDLTALEDRLCDGGGSRLIKELADHLKEEN